MFSQVIALLKNEYWIDSIFVYGGIIISSTLFAFASQINFDSFLMKNRTDIPLIIKKRVTIYSRQIQNICLFLSGLILWFFSAFADCGTDRASYGRIFSNVSFSDLISGWQEPGFILFNMFFRILGNNPRIIYIAISTVTLLLLYKVLYDLREDISIGYAILAYTSLFFIQSLSLMRIYMAAAILFCGTKYLRSREYLKYLAVVFVAFMVHYSAFIILLGFVVIVLLESKKYKEYVHVLFVGLGVVGLFCILVVGMPVLGKFMIFARFQGYFEEISSSSFGIMQMVYNVPICLLALAGEHFCDKQDKKIYFSFVVTTFLLSMLSYVIAILGRSVALFSVVYMFVIPKCMADIKKYLVIEKKKRNVYVLISIVCILYFVFRCMIYISEYKELDAVIPYVNIFF